MMFDKNPLTILEYHQSMLADHERVDAYRRAIFDTVRPGDVVLDIGTGTGILAFFACQAGARRVYAIEAGSIVEAARLACKQNGFDDRVEFIHGLSTKVELPERADVLITETIGNFGLEESILSYVLDARQRLLKDNAKIVPAMLALYVAPVEVPQIQALIESWSNPVGGLDFSSARAIAVNNPHWVKLDATGLLGEPAQLCEIDLAGITAKDIYARAKCFVNRSGTLHGLGGWFSAKLNCSGSVSITNAPPPNTPSWSHAFLPFATPCQVEAGDTIDITLRTAADATIWQWSGRCLRHSDTSGEVIEIARFDQSSFFGQMISVAALRQQSETYRPQLGMQGEVDRFILQSINGSAMLIDIGRRAAEQFPAHFRNEEEALARVRELSLQYSR